MDAEVEILPAGTVIANRYEILDPIGEGAMGVVYRAQHRLMKKVVALKLLHPGLMRSAELLERFRREAQAAAHIDHPNVCAATDFDSAGDGAFFLVMEFLEGSSLAGVLERDGRLSPRRSLHIIRQVLSALVRAHEMGIVHRDLKPDNIFLVKRESGPDFVKLLDFGIARVAFDDSDSIKLTKAGTVYGTPHYLSPEQAVGADIDHRADLYAVGIILFEILVGHPPFDGESLFHIMNMHVTRPAPTLASVVPEMPLVEALDEVLARLLAKKADERFQNARQVLDALDPIYQALHGVTEQTGEFETLNPLISGVLPTLHAGVAVGTLQPSDTAGISVDLEVPISVDLPLVSAAVAESGAAGTADSLLVPAAVPATGATPLSGRSPSAKRGLLEEGLSWLVARTGLSRPQVVVFLALGLLIMLVVLSVLVAVLSDSEGEPTEGGQGGAVAASGLDLGAPVLVHGQDTAELIKADELVRRAVELMGNEPRAALALLETVAEQYSGDPVFHKLMAQAMWRSGEAEEALRTALMVIRVVPASLHDQDLVDVFVGLLSMPDEAMSAQAEEALRGNMTETVVARLWQRATTGRFNEDNALRVRIKAMLDEQGGYAQLEPWQQAALELRLLDGRGCKNRRRVLLEIMEIGDPRALPVVEVYHNAPRRGCGTFNKGDCHDCMRRDLAQAIQLFSTPDADAEVMDFSE